MSSAIVALIGVAVMLSTVALMAQGSFRSINVLADAWKQMEVRSNEIARTKIEVAKTVYNSPLIDVTLKNSGQTILWDFDSWDVIVQYYEGNGTYHQKWLPYTATSPPGDNQWTVVGIYLKTQPSTPEVFEPGILDPGESVIIRIKLNPAAGNSASKQVVVGTPNGVTVSTNFN